MLVNVIETIVLFTLVISFWVALWVSRSAVARATAPGAAQLPSATEHGPDQELHLCRRGVAPFLK